MNEKTAQGRHADSARRRQRVTKAISAEAAAGEAVTVSAIARRAGVDRTFLYWHRDLLAQVHAAAAEPTSDTQAASVSRASLQADLAHALDRNSRLAAQVRLLETRLSQLLGEQVFRESGLGAPTDIGELQHQVIILEQRNVALGTSLEEAQQDLEAARAANRELTKRLNHGS
ncbi:DUF6262 family protein [Actinacidiphila glaucinigra]|uniref:DUF6262 family protein n=1 Tax=Actinacidiphila glaucinigra TaxID=235986 RepID=UPI0037CB39FA